MNQLFEEFITELVRRSLSFSEGGFIRRELREVWQSRGWTFHARIFLATATLQMSKNQM